MAIAVYGPGLGSDASLLRLERLVEGAAPLLVAARDSDSEEAEAFPRAAFLEATAGAEAGQKLDYEAAATLLRSFAFSENTIRSILSDVPAGGGNNGHAGSSYESEETEPGPGSPRLTSKQRCMCDQAHSTTISESPSTEEALARRALYNRRVGNELLLERAPTS